MPMTIEWNRLRMGPPLVLPEQPADGAVPIQMSGTHRFDKNTVSRCLGAIAPLHRLGEQTAFPSSVAHRDTAMREKPAWSARIYMEETHGYATQSGLAGPGAVVLRQGRARQDRKSTRLNSSHVKISY